MPIEIFDEAFVTLHHGINRATMKQAVIAQNIANANNPDYIPLKFDEVLNKAVKRAEKSVIIEEEMAALSKNAIEHSAYIKLLASKINVLRTVATQGRR